MQKFLQAQPLTTSGRRTSLCIFTVIGSLSYIGSVIFSLLFVYLLFVVCMHTFCICFLLVFIPEVTQIHSKIMLNTLVCTDVMLTHQSAV